MALASEFQSGGVLKNPSLRLLLSAEEARVFYVTLRPEKKGKKNEVGE